MSAVKSIDNVVQKYSDGLMLMPYAFKHTNMIYKQTSKQPL